MYSGTIPYANNDSSLELVVENAISNDVAVFDRDPLMHIFSGK